MEVTCILCIFASFTETRKNPHSICKTFLTEKKLSREESVLERLDRVINIRVNVTRIV